MMSEYTTLSSYRDALVAERKALDNVDVEFLVEERLSEIRKKVWVEVEADLNHTKLVTDIKIEAINDAINIVSRTAEDEEVSEVISDETY